MKFLMNNVGLKEKRLYFCIIQLQIVCVNSLILIIMKLKIICSVILCLSYCMTALATEDKENFYSLFRKLYESINVYQTGHTNPYYGKSGEERPVLVLYNETTGQRTTLTQSDTLKYLRKSDVTDFILSTDPQKTGKGVGMFFQVTIRNSENTPLERTPLFGYDFFTLPDTLKSGRKGNLTYLRRQTRRAFYDCAKQAVLDFRHTRTKGIYNEREQYWMGDSPEPEDVKYLEISLRSNEKLSPLSGLITVYLRDEETAQPEVEKGNLYALFRKIYESERIYTTGNSYFTGANQLNAFPTLLYTDSSDKYKPIAPYHLKNVHGKELRGFELYIGSKAGVPFGVRGEIFARLDIRKSMEQMDTLLSRKDKLPLILPNTRHPEEKGKFLLFVQRMDEALNAYNGEKDSDAITRVYWNDTEEKISDAELAQIQPDNVKTIVLESNWQGNRLVCNIRIYSEPI